ncbi:MAG: PEGA domain-containing protein [Patescibacteria group bacterium]
MKRFASLGLLFISALILSGCSLLPGGKKGALSVTTTPKATIFLDGEHLGSTPYFNEKLKAGEYVLKIVPESTGQALTPWEGRVNLSPNILTVVNRELGLTQDESSGEILSFEPLADKKAISISVVSTPDGAVIDLDGEPRGYAPISVDNVSEGEHIITISSPGFVEKTVKAKTVKGHKLIVSVQLARESAAVEPEPETKEATPSATPKVSPKISPAPSGSPKITASPKPTPKASPTGDIARPYVQITKDPGWARVRTGAGTNFETIKTADGSDDFKVYYPNKYSLKETSSSGWYKIEYEAGKTGWISGALAEKYE